MQAWWAEESSLKNIKNLTVQIFLTGSVQPYKGLKIVALNHKNIAIVLKCLVTWKYVRSFLVNVAFSIPYNMTIYIESSRC